MKRQCEDMQMGSRVLGSDNGPFESDFDEINDYGGSNQGDNGRNTEAYGGAQKRGKWGGFRKAYGEGMAYGSSSSGLVGASADRDKSAITSARCPGLLGGSPGSSATFGASSTDEERNKTFQDYLSRSGVSGISTSQTKSSLGYKINRPEAYDGAQKRGKWGGFGKAYGEGMAYGSSSSGFVGASADRDKSAITPARCPGLWGGSPGSSTTFGASSTDEERNETFQDYLSRSGVSGISTSQTKTSLGYKINRPEAYGGAQKRGKWGGFGKAYGEGMAHGSSSSGFVGASADRDKSAITPAHCPGLWGGSPGSSATFGASSADKERNKTFQDYLSRSGVSGISPSKTKSSLGYQTNRPEHYGKTPASDLTYGMKKEQNKTGIEIPNYSSHYYDTRATGYKSATKNNIENDDRKKYSFKNYGGGAAGQTPYDQQVNTGNTNRDTKTADMNNTSVASNRYSSMHYNQYGGGRGTYCDTSRENIVRKKTVKEDTLGGFGRRSAYALNQYGGSGADSETYSCGISKTESERGKGFRNCKEKNYGKFAPVCRPNFMGLGKNKEGIMSSSDSNIISGLGRTNHNNTSRSFTKQHQGLYGGSATGSASYDSRIEDTESIDIYGGSFPKHSPLSRKEKKKFDFTW